MDEQHLLNLLKHIVGRLLPNDSETSDRELLTQRIAEACWDGLILLMRSSVCGQAEICLEGLGYFFRHGDEWWFRPAAPIVEAQALELEREQGLQFLAERALFFLRQGVSILALIPEDISLHSDTSALGETVSDSLRRFIVQQNKAATLRQEIQNIEQQLANIRHILEGSSFSSDISEPQKIVYPDPKDMSQETLKHYSSLGGVGIATSSGISGIAWPPAHLDLLKPTTVVEGPGIVGGMIPGGSVFVRMGSGNLAEENSIAELREQIDLLAKKLDQIERKGQDRGNVRMSTTSAIIRPMER